MTRQGGVPKATGLAGPAFAYQGARPACAGQYEVFDAPDDGRLGPSGHRELWMAALQVCADCPLLDPCREWSRAQPYDGATFLPRPYKAQKKSRADRERLRVVA